MPTLTNVDVSARPTKYICHLTASIRAASDFAPSSHHRKQINDYVLEAKIGREASSCVYLAVDQKTQMKYVAKRLRLSGLVRAGGSLATVEREVRLMRLFRHPNILRLIEVLHVPATNDVYLLLEYANNGSLADFIAQSHQLPQASIMSICRQVTQALKYLHDAGFVHQDVKPLNILLDRTGRAILADFSIGHSFGSSSMVVGSPAYQAPEALDDE
jgi:serine/threonine protein kinase